MGTRFWGQILKLSDDNRPNNQPIQFACCKPLRWFKAKGPIRPPDLVPLDYCVCLHVTS